MVNFSFSLKQKIANEGNQYWFIPLRLRNRNKITESAEAQSSGSDRIHNTENN